MLHGGNIRIDSDSTRESPIQAVPTHQTRSMEHNSLDIPPTGGLMGGGVGKHNTETASRVLGGYRAHIRLIDNVCDCPVDIWYQATLRRESPIPFLPPPLFGLKPPLSQTKTTSVE